MKRKGTVKNYIYSHISELYNRNYVIFPSSTFQIEIIKLMIIIIRRLNSTKIGKIDQNFQETWHEYINICIKKNSYVRKK